MNLSQPLIALGGRLRSGKDCVADRLVAEHGFIKMGMSDALHEALLAIDPGVHVGEAHAYAHSAPVGWQQYSDLIEAVGYVETKTVPEVRRLLQKLGTEVGRDMIGENVWVNIMASKIVGHLCAGRPVVVTGIRFPNEVGMVRDLEGTAVWIDRPGVDAHSGTASHSSENSVGADDFMVIIKNDSTLEDLRLKADELVQ